MAPIYQQLQPRSTLYPMMPAFPLSPLSPSFPFNNPNNLKRHQSGPRSQTSFLPFEIPRPIAEAFDLPLPRNMNPRSGRQAKEVKSGEEESFSPFGDKSGMGFGFRSGEKDRRTSKKDKRGTMILPILPPPPSAPPPPPVHSRTLTPAESMDSFLSSYSPRSNLPRTAKRFDVNRDQTTRFGYRPSHISSVSSTSHSGTAGHLTKHHSYTSCISATSSLPRPTPRHSPSEDDKAIAALERLSHHLLAENKIPGFKPLVPGREDAYERTRAVPRQRKESVHTASLEKEGYVVVPRPKGKETAKGLSYVKASEMRAADTKKEKEKDGDSRPASTPQSTSLRGWKMIRPTSSSGKKDRPVSDGLPSSHRHTFSRPVPPRAPPEMELPPVPAVDTKSISRSRINRGLVRMRSISSTRLTSPEPILSRSSAPLARSLIDPAPPIPPRAASRPQAIRRASANSCTTLLTVQTGVHIPIVLSPGREVKEGIPRGAVRDSLTSMTGTEVDLMSPRHTPIQLGPLPPLPPLSKIPIPSVPTRKNSLLTPQTRLSKLRIKRNTPTTASLGSTAHGSEESGTTVDSIAEEGMRVLEEVRKREKLVPRDEPRLNRGKPDEEEMGQMSSSKEKGGMTAFSFLSLFDEEDSTNPEMERSINLTDDIELLSTGTRRASSETMNHDTSSQIHPLAASAVRRLNRSLASNEQARPSTPLISHIIPPEERSRIGTSLPRISRNRESISESISSLEGPPESISQMRDIFLDNPIPAAEEGDLPTRLNPSFPITTTSTLLGRSISVTPRRPKPPLSLQPLSPLYESSGPPTALSPPPRSRKMTARAGSAPGRSLGHGQDTGIGMSIAQVQASRSFSLGERSVPNSSRIEYQIGRSVSYGAECAIGEEGGGIWGRDSPTPGSGRITGPPENLTPFGPTRKDLLACLPGPESDRAQQPKLIRVSKADEDEDDGVEPLSSQQLYEPLRVYPDSPTDPVSPDPPLGEFGNLDRVAEGSDTNIQRHTGWKDGSWSSVESSRGVGQEYGHLRYFRAVMG